MKNFSSPILLTASVIYLSLQLCPASYAMEHQVTVTGSCSRRVTTDRGAVVVTADILDRDLKSAIKKATHQYERVLESIKKLRLENAEIQTVEYNVAEVKEWEKNKSVSKGFRARIGLSVSTSDIQRLGEVTEIAAREEIRDVSSMTTYLSDEKIRKEQDLCLKEAAEHAKSKADKLATTLGASLGRIANLSENNVSTPPHFVPMMRQAFMKDEAQASASPSVEGGRQEVSATVTATFELK